TKKLDLTLLVYVRPGKIGAGSPDTGHSYTGETWQLYAMADKEPVDVTLNAAFDDGSSPPNPVATPRDLPDSQNVNDGIKLARGVVHAVQDNSNQAGQIYKVVAIW